MPDDGILRVTRPMTTFVRRRAPVDAG
jgi:hypothetical protein